MAQWEIFANHCLKLYYLVVELLLLLPVILQFLFPLLGGGHGGHLGPDTLLVHRGLEEPEQKHAVRSGAAAAAGEVVNIPRGVARRCVTARGTPGPGPHLG